MVLALVFPGMKPAALLLWLALFGGESSTEPSALVIERPPVAASAWFGAWLVGVRREPVAAQFSSVPGREELTGLLTWEEGASATTEHWIGRMEGERLRLNLAGVGEGRLAAAPDGRLVGRLSRNQDAGDLQLFRSREEARARLGLP